MADQRNGGIAWTDETWNPIRGCSRVSEGCRNCYAERDAARFIGPGQPYEGLIAIGEKGRRWNGQVRFLPEKLAEPLRWTKPRRVFVNSMSDLFHEALDFETIAAIFGVMVAAPRHTFQVLTKRPERARDWFRWALDQEGNPVRTCVLAARAHGCDIGWPLHGVHPLHWPPPNVWLGVSVENQATADERIPLLLETPAAIRWVSYEPAIGPVDFGLSSATCTCCDRWSSRWVRLHRPVVSEMPFGPLTSAAPGVYRASSNRHGALSVQALDGKPIGIKPAEFDALPRLDWVVIGGESGPGARPFDLVWARSVIAQAKDTGCKVFVKQLGARPHDGDPCDDERTWWPGPHVNADGWPRFADRKGSDPSEWPEDLRVREWPEVPR